MQKSLDKKLARIVADPSCGDFILADAKDPDMALGIAASASVERQTESRRVSQHPGLQQQIREIVEQQLVDIMLMSVEQLATAGVAERLFDDSPVTPAIRVNDTTDIWLVGSQAKLRTTTIAAVSHGRA